MEPSAYLRVLRRGWVWIVGCLVLALGVAAIVVLAAKPLYESTVRLLVSGPLDDPRLDDAGAVSAGIQQRLRSYPGIIEGDVLASRVEESLETGGVEVTPGYQTTAEVVGGTDLLDITVTSSSPEDAQELATAYAEEFLALVSEIEASSSGAEPLVSVTVVGAASASSAVGSPQPLRTLSVAVVVGLTVGVGVAFLWDSWDTRIRRSDELSKITDAPTLGVIPIDAERPQRPASGHMHMSGLQAEAYRRLRANLHLLDPQAAHLVMTITSSVPGEGKTTTTVNLGVALASAGVRVLVLDGDLRKPGVGAYLGLSEEVGLTSLLTGSAEVDDAVQPYRDSTMQVITSGPGHSAPGELLYSTKVSALLDELRMRADVVLIDSPSLLPVADGAVLAALSDGALLVTRYGATRAEQVREAVASLQQTGGRLLGTVLSMMPTKGVDAYPYRGGYAVDPSVQDSM